MATADDDTALSDLVCYVTQVAKGNQVLHCPLDAVTTRVSEAHVATLRLFLLHECIPALTRQSPINANSIQYPHGTRPSEPKLSIQLGFRPNGDAPYRLDVRHVNTET